MRRTWRAVTAALISSTAVTAAALVAAPLSATAATAATATAATGATAAAAATAAPASAVPPMPSGALAGTWVNTDHATRNVVDFVVGTSRRGLTVDGFGACTPSPCEWGKIPGTVFGRNVSAATGTSFEAQWNFGFARIVVLATYGTRKKVPTLTVREFTTFTEDSNRANYTATETFTKGKAVKVTKAGTSAADYPVGHPVSAVGSLSSIWVNTAGTGNIRAVIISPGGGGLLAVHAYGFCSPVPCNWGTVNGITFGSGIGATTGSTFLAPYKFGFAKKLLDGTVNAAGTLLTVRIWTEFTDKSGRSNYLNTDTFVPLG